MHIPSKHKTFIFVAIVVMTIPVAMLLLYKIVSSDKTVRNPEESSAAANDEDTLVNDYSKHCSKKTEFKGLKNDTIPLPDGMLETIATELGAFDWSSSFGYEKRYLYHQTIFAKNFTSDAGTGKSHIVLTFSNSTANLCHACSGQISLFEFQWQEDQWKLIRKYLAFTYGDEDALEPRGIELVRIGSRNKYAVLLHTGFYNMGHDQESKALYMIVRNSMKPVFEFTCYENYFDPPPDREYTEGYTDMRILNSYKKFFLIETKPEDANWDDRERGIVKRFGFNGKEYVEQSGKHR